MARGNYPVDLVLIVGALAGERRKRIDEPVEKRREPPSMSLFINSMTTISPLSPSTPILIALQTFQFGCTATVGIRQMPKRNQWRPPANST
jgi:hypothetical protein